MRMYPSLVNCTTLDLFNEWPPEALLEVGEKYLMSVDLQGDEQVNYILRVLKLKIILFRKLFFFKILIGFFSFIIFKSKVRIYR
jgi:hypothetical protein